MGLIFQNLAMAPDQDVVDLSRLQIASDTKPVLTMDEPVARACASYRQWRDTGHMWSDLDTVTVTESDRALAHELKRYYRESMTLQALRGNNANQSEFRRKLAALVTDQLTITLAEIGLLHRLPYLYHEDLALDRVVTQTTNPTQHQDKITSRFRLIETVLRSRRSVTSMQYWLVSDQVSGAFLLAVTMDNPLRMLWESAIQQPLELQVRAYARTFPGHRNHRWYHQVHIDGAQIA